MPRNKLQNLPEEKYPRSYTPELRRELLERGRWKAGVFYTILPGNPNVPARHRIHEPGDQEDAGEYDRALSAGEQAASEEFEDRRKLLRPNPARPFGKNGVFSARGKIGIG